MTTRQVALDGGRRGRWRPTGLDPWALLPAVLFLLLVFVAVFGERIAPHEPIYYVVEHGHDPRPFDPGLVFPLGSDMLGRDLVSVVLAGARWTLTIVLVAGLSRLVLGLVLASVAAASRLSGVVVDVLADVLSAVPATLVAVLLIKGLVREDTTSLPILVGALLVVGWAGPCRVIRAELGRLARAPFTEGARAIGASPLRLLLRHQLPSLVPLMATNLGQQVVASLVLVAELGVLGVTLGSFRTIDISASLSTVRTGPENAMRIPDQPEWGSMLATSRTVEILWATRWVVLIPGAAFALTAVAAALIGFSLARRYARRDVLMDGRGFAVVALAAVLLVAVAPLVPPRYAAAGEWAVAARGALRTGADLDAAFADAGMVTREAVREVAHVERTGPATVRMGDVSVTEHPGQVQSLVVAGDGSGPVEAPLVFAARGIVPKNYPPLNAYGRSREGRTGLPMIGEYIKDYPDDFAGIDVRGKVVLVVRFLGVEVSKDNTIAGPDPHDTILNAFDRGAAAVVFVDPTLPTTSEYSKLERGSAPQTTDGPPVVVIDAATARALVAPLGLDLTPLLGYDSERTVWPSSPSRDLGVTARVEVPLRRVVQRYASQITSFEDVSAAMPQIVLWTELDPKTGMIDPLQADVLAAIARLASERRAPFLFVRHDPRSDTAAVGDALAERHVSLVIALDQLRGDALRFTTANGDLIPAFDEYAAAAGTAHAITRATGQEIPPLWHVRTVHIAARPADEAADERSDAVALLGYIAGRFALGAPELPR